VFADSPTLIAPNLGVAAATSISFGQDALDYYDEGTWTPIAADASSGGNVSATSAASASYTRIGNMCNVRCRFTTLSIAGMTGANDVFIRGLPFTALSETGTVYYSGNIEQTNNAFTFTGSPRPVILDSTAYVQIGEVASGTAMDFTTVTELSGASFSINLWYPVTA
jgi:hypothetical protein